jgi:hypothetical protein
LLGAQPDPGISYRDSYVHLSRRRINDVDHGRHAPVRRELQCVADEIERNLADFTCIGSKPIWKFLRVAEAKVESLLAGLERIVMRAQ